METEKITETSNKQIQRNATPNQTKQVLYHQGKMPKYVLMMKKRRKENILIFWSSKLPSTCN